LGIDYEKLSSLTENYSSSDIKLITDEASRKRIKDKEERLTMEILEFTIKQSKPSISISELNQYINIKSKMEGKQTNNNERPRIGFNNN
jgi:transitional endoplasmic reticulum ATPase